MRFESYLPSSNLYIPIDKNKALATGMISQEDLATAVSQIPVQITRQYITKDQLAVLDIIMNNIYDRPIYFSVTCQEEKLMGIQDYMQLEGLGLRIIPVKSASQKEFYIYGSGRVDTDKVYDRVMNKWKFGRFDEEEMFVDASYGASIQAQKMIIWRTADAMMRKGEKEKAVALTQKYFDSFPHMNFPYDARTIPHINIFLQGGENEKAKEHIRILAKEAQDYMEFFDTISSEDLKTGFDLDYQIVQQCNTANAQYDNHDQ